MPLKRNKNTFEQQNNFWLKKFFFTPNFARPNKKIGIEMAKNVFFDPFFLKPKIIKSLSGGSRQNFWVMVMMVTIFLCVLWLVRMIDQRSVISGATIKLSTRRIPQTSPSDPFGLSRVSYLVSLRQGLSYSGGFTATSCIFWNTSNWCKNWFFSNKIINFCHILVKIMQKILGL